jgi:hypothetical protein
MWSAMANWALVGTAVGVLLSAAVALTLGGTIMNVPYEYTLARLFYSLGFAILLFRIGYWLAFERPESDTWIGRLFITAIIFALIGVVWVASIMWVTERQHRQFSGSTKGKQSIAEKAKLPPTTAELGQHLRDQLQFLRLSSAYFDKGVENEAKRIATSLHILLVGTGDSPSLLEQMRIRDGMTLQNTALKDVDGNLFSYMGLVVVKMTKGKVSYQARCLAPPRTSSYDNLPFEKWWRTVILNNRKGVVYTRETLVIAVAEQDGGIKVASLLDPSYVELARKTGIGWRSKGDKPILGVELHSIRQIAWEFLDAISKQYPQYLQH